MTEQEYLTLVAELGRYFRADLERDALAAGMTKEQFEASMDALEIFVGFMNDPMSATLERLYPKVKDAPEDIG